MNPYELRRLKSRAATMENPNAEKGKGGTAGGGIKGSPAIKGFRRRSTATLLDVEGPGMVRHIWMTSHRREPHHYRNLILRMYWEGSDVPSVEAPWSDFFGVAHGVGIPYHCHFLGMHEGRGMNCWWPMPFAEHARITLTNESRETIDWLFYQVDFTQGDDVTQEMGRFHARFRRENPCPYGHDFTIMETSGARGVYMGCNIGVRSLAPGWWGEGEVKMFMDGDGLYPTICGTGMEDYMGSAWGLGEHHTPYQGCPLHRGNFASIYRHHAVDPIYFQNGLKVAVQQMGAGLKGDVEKIYGAILIWRSKNHPNRRPDDGYYLRSDDYCATAYWYQWPLQSEAPAFPSKEARSADLFGAAEAD